MKKTALACIFAALMTNLCFAQMNFKASKAEFIEGVTDDEKNANKNGVFPVCLSWNKVPLATSYTIMEKDNNDEWKNYSPQFKTRQIKDIGPWILVARDMYFSDLAKEQIVIHAYKNNSDIIYSQSLLYDQNRFGNAMFNNWDGSLVVDEKENKILTAIIGAGKKEINNTFSGVLIDL